MRKLITIIAMMFAMFTLAAQPKVTILDTNCGNTKEYVNKILTDNNLTKSNAVLTGKILKYVNMFKQGTFLIENEGEAAIISVFNGKTIHGSSVLINYGKEEN